MTPVRINRLRSAIQRADKPKPKRKNPFTLVGGNKETPEEYQARSESVRKARAYLYRHWNRLPEHKKTKRAWARIKKRSEIRAQYSAISATDNFVGTYNNFYDSQFLDGINDSADPGVGIAAIPFTYKCVTGVGKYIALAGYSSELTYSYAQFGQSPIEWSNRYRDACTFSIESLPATGTLYEGQDEITELPHVVTDPDDLMFVPAGTGTETFTYTATDFSGVSPIATVTLETTAAVQEGFGAEALPAIATVASPSVGSFVEGTDWYVDNSHGSASDANGNGTPAAPRATLPPHNTTFAAGTRVFIRGGVDTPYVLPAGGLFKWFCNGTSGSPVIIHGVIDGPNQPIIQAADMQDRAREFRLAAQYTVFEGIALNNVRIRQRVDAGDPTGGNLVYRNMLVYNQPNNPTGSAIQHAVGDNKVYINCHIRDIGYVDPDLTNENDVHGVQVGGGVSGVWVFDCLIHDCSGDSIQINSGTGASNVYICRNKCHSDQENAIDMKQITDHIISENDLWDYRPISYGSSGSDGTPVVFNDDGPIEYIWMVNNRVWDACNGIRSQAEWGYVIGNLFWNLHAPTNTAGGVARAWVSGNTGTNNANGYFINNTCIRCDAGIYIWTGAGASVVAEYQIAGNYFGALNVGSNEPVFYRLDDTNADRVTLLDYNFYQGTFTAEWRGANRDLAYMQGQGFETNSQESVIPRFTDEILFDFTLQSNSPLIGANVLHDVYTDFNTRYSRSILFDIFGTARPTGGTWDIGAVEYNG